MQPRCVHVLISAKNPLARATTSSGVRTSQMPNFSFHRSSTPMPYSFGKPALNCCGGSLSTLGNMNRPVAARAAAVAAENAPHARPIHARRVRSGEVSSAARVAAAVFAAAGVRAPADAAFVVLPARSGIGAAGGRGAAGLAATARAGFAAPGTGAGFAGTAPVSAAACAVAGSSPPGTGLCCGVAAGFAPVGGALGTSGFVSSAI